MGVSRTQARGRGLAAASPWLVALLGGAMAGLALPPLGAPPLAWLALALLWALLESPVPRRAAACWGAMAVLLSHRWLLALHPLDWIGVPPPLSLPICWLLLLLCATLAGLLLLVWADLALRLGPRGAGSALVLAAVWGLGEVLLAQGPLFWIGLGASALPGDPPLAALASVGGAGLVAAVQVLISWGIWRLLGARLQRPGRRLGQVGLAMLLLVGVHALGALQLAALEQRAAAGAGGVAEQVLVVQPAIPTREKFQWQARRRLQRQLQAALLEAEARAADLVVLPEGALGLEPELPEPAAVELLSGGFRWQESAGAEPEQRSALLRFPPGAQRHTTALDKARLVPLGEWIPLAQVLRWSGLSAVGGVQPGAPSRLLLRPAGNLAAAICYEIADGRALAQAVAQGGGWLLASANLDPYPQVLQEQFTALARLRAMESARWLVSAANTGPSLLIDPAGRIVERLVSGQSAVQLLRVPVLHGRTAYGRWGETPVVLLLVLGLGWWRWERLRATAEVLQQD